MYCIVWCCTVSFDVPYAVLHLECDDIEPYSWIYLVAGFTLAGLTAVYVVTHLIGSIRFTPLMVLAMVIIRIYVGVSLIKYILYYYIIILYIYGINRKITRRKIMDLDLETIQSIAAITLLFVILYVAIPVIFNAITWWSSATGM